MTSTPFGRLEMDVGDLPRFDLLTRPDARPGNQSDSFERRLERERTTAPPDRGRAERSTSEHAGSAAGTSEGRSAKSRGAERRDARASTDRSGQEVEPEGAALVPTTAGQDEAGPTVAEARTETSASSGDPERNASRAVSSTGSSGSDSAGDGIHAAPIANRQVAANAGGQSSTGAGTSVTGIQAAPTSGATTSTNLASGQTTPATQKPTVSSPNTPLGSVVPRYLASARGFDADSVIKRIAVETAKGNGRVEIELDPPELGRIDIELVTEDGRTRVVLAVEKSEVADSIERRLAELTRALEAQGLRIDDAEIHQRGPEDGFKGRDRSPSGRGTGTEEDVEQVAPRTTRVRHRVEGAGLDLIA